MDRPLLFAETPRGGRWNHRFLVPDDLPLSEEQLAEQAASARRDRQGTDYLAAVRVVRQPSSGRTADELLVLHGVQVDQLDAATRGSLMRRLEARLDDLEQLVQAIDWEHEGKRLLVCRRELSDWFDADFRRPLAESRRSAPPRIAPAATMKRPSKPAIEPAHQTAAEPAAETTAGRRPSTPASRPMSRYAPLAGLLLAAAGLFLWRPWQSDRATDGVPLTAGAAAICWSDEDLERVEAPLRSLADAWRLPARDGPLPVLCKAVAEKLERDLVIVDAAPQPAPAAQRLPEIFAALAASLMGARADNAAALADLLHDAGFQSRLMSVYTSSPLDYAAPLRRLTAPDDYDGQARLRALAALCPAVRKEQVRMFREVAAEAKALSLAAADARSLDADTALVRRLHDSALAAATLRWAVAADPGPATLAIFNEQDAADAAVLLQWLSRTSLVESAGSSEEDLVADVRQFVALKRDALETLARQSPPAERVLCIRLASLLLRLAAVWDAA